MTGQIDAFVAGAEWADDTCPVHSHPWLIRAEAEKRYPEGAGDLDAAELQGRIVDALHIHRPCHSFVRWRKLEDACVRSHDAPEDGAECLGCGYDFHDQPTSWPCATAQALGATR